MFGKVASCAAAGVVLRRANKRSCCFLLEDRSYRDNSVGFAEAAVRVWIVLWSPRRTPCGTPETSTTVTVTG
jgi:hypothetical protein